MQQCFLPQHTPLHECCRGAVAFVEGEVRRLLSGHVSLWELVMTGGLWRITGQQLEKAALEGGDGGITGE